MPSRPAERAFGSIGLSDEANMHLSTTFSPKLDALSPEECDRLVWEGPLDHVGSVHAFTPLRDALSGKTNCACYLIMVGMVDLVGELTQAKIDKSFSEKIKEFIYLYQFDWRYPKAWNTNPEFISGHEKWESIRQSIPYYFLRVLQRSEAPFHDGPVTQDTAFMINFALHIAGPSRSRIIKDWIETVIERSNAIAPCPEQQSLYYPDFASVADYMAAVLRNHGTPLSPRTLDPAIPLGDIDHRAEALSVLDSIDFVNNRALRPASDFEESWGIKGPYFSIESNW